MSIEHDDARESSKSCFRLRGNSGRVESVIKRAQNN
jgi:hypothetical protein